MIDRTIKNLSPEVDRWERAKKGLEKDYDSREAIVALITEEVMTIQRQRVAKSELKTDKVDQLGRERLAIENSRKLLERLSNKKHLEIPDEFV